ncbi:lysostaphin resistance A-like protein [Schleiferilactobacillus harbinensis]|uniref:CPBP family intramembrane glutamic endopeptidase n=2 Tax=Schleiferilactobacillus harbinensis TaxID=304207 RepID=UPI0039BFCD82
MIYSKRAQGEISNSVLKAVLIWMVFSMSLLFSYMFVSVLTQSVTNSTIAHIMESTSYIWAWWATRFVSRWLIVGPNVINNLDQKYRYQRWVPLLLLGTTICVSVMASIVPVKSISLVVKGTAYLLIAWGEETVFRGFIYQYLRAYFTPRTANLIQAAMFAFLGHTGNMSNFYFNVIVRFPIGLLLGLLANRTGTLKASIFIHWVYNLTLDICIS